MNASTFLTLALYRLRHSAENRQAGCQSDKDFVCRILRIQPVMQHQGKKAPKRLVVSKHETSFLNGHL